MHLWGIQGQNLVPFGLSRSEEPDSRDRTLGNGQEEDGLVEEQAGASARYLACCSTHSTWSSPTHGRCSAQRSSVNESPPHRLSHCSSTSLHVFFLGL